MENLSAFQIHHIMNKTVVKTNKKNKKKKSRSNIVQIKENGISKKNKKIQKTAKTSNKVNKSSSNNRRPSSLADIPTAKPMNQKLNNRRLSLADIPFACSSNQKLNDITIQNTLLNRRISPSPKDSSDAETPTRNSHSSSPKSKLSFEKSFTKKCLFNWLINPIDVDDFMTNYWETKPLYISKRHNEFSVLLSTPIIDNLLHYSNIIYTKNIDVTFYSDGIKELNNLEGVARPHVVWDFYCNKCSIRLLNPQTFVPNIHKLDSELQEYFGCFVGCNAYLTPPHSQGFAPHYDDIEAFILQIEGKKMWKVYEPRENEELPRYSSCDMKECDIGEPIMEVLLEEGDVLYLPRGYIHQACTQDSNHSLHITVSVYQRNAWIDLLEKAIPRALENAWKKDVEYRKGLPLDYLRSAGFARNPNLKDRRIAIKENIKKLIIKLADHVQIDSAVDQLGHKFMEDALPPVLTEEEKKCTVFGGGLYMTKEGQVQGIDEFTFHLNTEIVLLRQYVSRFVKEIEKGKSGQNKVVYRLYYTTDNSLEYHGETPSLIIIPKSSVKAVQALFNQYPKYITIEELPHENDGEKVTLVSDLWERGIIRTRRPNLKNI